MNDHLFLMDDLPATDLFWLCDCGVRHKSEDSCPSCGYQRVQDSIEGWVWVGILIDDHVKINESVETHLDDYQEVVGALKDHPEMLRLLVEDELNTLMIVLKNSIDITDWVINKPANTIPNYLEAINKFKNVAHDLTGTLDNLADGGKR